MPNSVISVQASSDDRLSNVRCFPNDVAAHWPSGEQQEGMLPRIFAVTAIIALVVFSLWFWIIEGPAPTLAPH